MPYINYGITRIQPVQHIRAQPHASVGSAYGAVSPLFHPPSVHNSFMNAFPLHHNVYTQNAPVVTNPVMKKKKSISWKNTNNVYFTYSKDEYDRTIDSEQIKENNARKYHYRMMKSNPIERSNSVFQFLSGMDFD